MKKGNSIIFAQNPPLVKNIIFIDGITRSGKFWLANFFNHFDNVEHHRIEQFMDHVSLVNYFGLMDNNSAINILRGMANLHIFETAIGRNINFRFADSSSVFKSPKLQDYLQRVCGPDCNQVEVFDQLSKSNKYFAFVTHEWLSCLNIQLKAFPSMKLVRIERNPVDLVYAWYNTGIGLNRMVFSYRIEGVKGSVPWFVYKWRDEFETMSDMDRIIKSIIFLDESAKEVVKNLSVKDKRKIFFTSYESLSVQPIEEAKRVAQFLGTTVNDSVYAFAAQPIFKKRNNLALENLRKERLEVIKKHASKKMFSLIKKAGEEYSPPLINPPVLVGK